MEKTKLNFFQQIKTAVAKPTEYYQLSKVSGGRLTGFVFLFALIIVLFTIVPTSYQLLSAGSISKVLNEDLPDFKMSHGQLNVAERFEKEEGYNYILVDTSVEKFTEDDIDSSYDEMILVSKTNIISYQNSRIQEIKFSQLGNISFDKSIVNLLVPLIYVVLVLIVIFIYLFTVAGFYLSALLYSLVGLIVSSVSHMNVPYVRIFKVAIYGKVTTAFLSILIQLLRNYAGLPIQGYIGTMIGIIVTCTYVVYGTLSHNNEEAPSDQVPPAVY